MSSSAALSGWIASTLLLGLRIAPAFAFAPPFTLVRMPLLFRLLLGLGLSFSILAASPGAILLRSDSQTLIPAVFHELALGTLLVLVLQLLFGALYLAGRTVDIQAGIGLALLFDPTTRTQTPLVGTLFAYAAAAIFFSLDGHLDLLRFMAATLRLVPLGGWVMPDDLARIGLLAGTLCSMALGFAGAVILALFLVDMALALLSRTVPQMNIFVLGFQVKTLVMLVVLPLTFGLASATLVHMIAFAFDALPGLL